MSIDSPPLPVPDHAFDPSLAPFWDGLAASRVVLPHCTSCAEWIWYPRSWCPHCGCLEVEWAETSGRGHVYTFAVVRRGEGDYRDHAPFVLAYVDLDEGPRVLTNVLADPDAVRIAMPVRAAFPVGGARLLRFAPA
jgi:uncharacterized protein